MTVKKIVCLANSRKLAGRCLAGKVVGGSPSCWIRPVSSRPHEEVSEYERQYEDGSDPQVLDVVSVPLVEQRPKNYQQENWLLNPEHYWRKEGTVAWAELANFVEGDEKLWINDDSTYNGLNDRIPLDAANQLRSSLRLIGVSKVSLKVFAPGQAFGNAKRRVQAHFTYLGDRYRLWITDPGFETKYLSMADGTYELGECFLTVSLGEPYEGYCYKLVAAIIPRGP